MASRYSDPHSDEPWAEPLRREAAAHRPAFSEERHARILEALKPLRRERRSRIGPAGRRRLAGLLALAALVLVAVWGAWWQAGRSSSLAVRPPRPRGVEAGNGLAELQAMARAPDRTAEQLDVLVESTRSRRWAYLDHDARVATQLLMEQIPFDMLAAGDAPATRTDL